MDTLLQQRGGKQTTDVRADSEHVGVASTSNGFQQKLDGVVLNEDFIDTGAMEEVAMEPDEDDYDFAITGNYGHDLVYEMYQPIETEFTLICKICLQLGKHFEFEDRAQYSTHRYKFHGSFNNSIICPFSTCKEIYASMGILRKHLMFDHKSPLEMHHQLFPNMADFERWRHLVELASNCRFMMHTKQPNHKRQVMNCSRSEHKMILQSKKHRLPRLRMEKEGACCPSFISFRVDDATGRVHVFFQLYHTGHAMQNYTETDSPEQQAVFTVDASGSGRFPSLHFPEKPEYLGSRAMQFIQVDIIDMTSAVYSTSVYGKVLIVTDLHTGFIWAKPLPDVIKTRLILQLLTDLFCQFGIPEGYCCCASQAQGIVRDVMKALCDVFLVEMREIFNEMPDYDLFRNMLLDQAAAELKNANRWVEMLQFAVMTMNQSGTNSPFERMFKRKPRPGEANNADEDPEPSNSNGSNHLITARYQVGDRVYLRNLDSRPGRGNTVPYLYGVIGEVDWNGSPHFPYKVHYSKNSEPWPTESCVSSWTTPFDILPTTHDLLLIRDEDRRRVISTLLCSCRRSGAAKEGDDSCSLFRNQSCANGMARFCCLQSGIKCKYHEVTTGQESYQKLELLSSYFSSNCHPDQRRRLAQLLRIRYPDVAEAVIHEDSVQPQEQPLPSTSDSGDAGELIDVSGVSESKIQPDVLPVSRTSSKMENRTIVRRKKVKSASRIVVHTTSTNVPAVEEQISSSHQNGSSVGVALASPSKRLSTENIQAETPTKKPSVSSTSDGQTRRSGRNPKMKSFADFVTM